MTTDRKSVERLLAEHRNAHTNLNIFYAIIAICEGGCFYNEPPAVQRIIAICKAESDRQLKKMDRAGDRLRALAQENRAQPTLAPPRI